MKELRGLPIEVFKNFMKIIYNNEKKVPLIEKFIKFQHYITYM